MQLRENKQICAFISDKLEVFLLHSPSLSCVKTGFLLSKLVSCFTNNRTGWKNLNFLREHSLTVQKLGLSLGQKKFLNKLVLNTRFNLRSWYVQIHQILIKY